MCTFEHFSFMLCRVWHTEKENDKRNPDIVRFLFAVDLDRKFINAFADVMTNSHSNSYVWNVRTMRISRALDSQKKQNDIILYIHGGYPFVVDWMMSKKKYEVHLSYKHNEYASIQRARRAFYAQYYCSFIYITHVHVLLLFVYFTLYSVHLKITHTAFFVPLTLRLTAVNHRN